MRQQSRKRTTIALAVLTAIVTTIVAISWRGQRVLSSSERMLVGTWRIEPAGLPANQVYNYVFRDDGIMTGEIVHVGKHVEKDFQVKWRLDGSDLIFEPFGMDAVISTPLRAVGYLCPQGPMQILSWEDDFMRLDRGGKQPSELTRLK